MKLSNEIQQRIAIIRFFMIFGVVLLHTPQYVPLPELGHTPFDIVKAFFQNAMFRATVPVLTTISGFLLFNANHDKDFGSLLKKKFKTLVIPFLAFNLPLLGAAWLAGRYFGLELYDGLAAGDTMTWLNAAFGINGLPINYPLNFLRDLVVIMLLIPLFSLALRRNPFLGLAVVAAVFIPDLDGPLILRNTMPLNFYLGAMAAVCRWNLKALDRFAVPCMGLFVAACCMVIAFKITNLTFLRLVSMYLLWPASAILYNSALGKWLASKSKYSFFIFLCHAPLLAVSWMLYSKYPAVLPYQLYWILTPVIVSIALVILYMLAMRLFPAFFSFITGGKPVENGSKAASGSHAPANTEAVPGSGTNRTRIGLR